MPPSFEGEVLNSIVREPLVRFGSVRFLPVPVHTGSASKKIKEMKNIIFCVFQLRNGFWTLPGGPLDPLDQYKNPFIFYFLNFFIYFHCFAINDHLIL